MVDVNIYCDESNHLEGDSKPMVLGAIYCPREKTSTINRRIREIKAEHGFSEDYEVKWTKASSRRKALYIDLINYFFDIDDIGIRAIVANKDNLNHQAFSQTHDDWYYKIYYLLLTKLISSKYKFRICLDKKDTQGKQRVDRLRDVLCNTEYDFEHKIIYEIREVHSDQVQIVQMVDLLIGAIQYNLTNKGKVGNAAKIEIVEHLKKKSGRSLEVNTLPSEFKLNLFFWGGNKNV